MNKQEITSLLEKEKLVAIIRQKNQQEVQPIVRALVEGGVKALEITSNTPGFLEEIRNARTLYPNVLVGAGTVTNKTLAQQAIEAGAQFLVTPNVEVSMIPLAHSHGVPVIMGALTPSEVCMAHEHGADIIKLFPAGIFGLDYFKAIKGPLNTLKFFVVGGISTDNIKEWMMAGADGFGIGSELTKMGDPGNPNEITQKAKSFIEQIEACQ
ncbi:bifunctional 4-hydroxy-2-oxoglutarate aldolase/2-dehydro-3-deoxy-phosphogluconate aldolase [Flagellimonas olearia]|uniref:Bifunctional 4-hydroxy-2-oxoglutarate aldolase/2-dehydro-3-deoxy-phosphogluconate aldolase n=1 Tax=Flagellimonas olearia TaxID=552546 RepID=A0A6I1E8T4_9FLAO|nr:bifunctional 4-hydroxy-2-oxoglutarate aldolase/2-dehydro-3-deoxy-phosphogluconate aldolase [Allomuricauda olearia]KAB7530114.1 bifunctional 4-hydroxy-2-oxoglutarate aldolase/2-dehydro-3-deoxy-phosphogluconate aldolase [Allomuricauda olearia]